VQDSQNRSNNPGGSNSGSSGGGGGNRRRRSRPPGGGQGNNNNNPNRNNQSAPKPPQANARPNQNNGPRPSGNSNRNRRGGTGRVLTTNQVLVKYDNLLEQHLITRRKYYEYFNRVDERQLIKLEKNFFDSIEHLRRFEANLEPWQREALEKRKTERYRLDLTYSNNRDWNPEEIAKEGFQPDENEDPHFKESQKEAFEEYKEDTEESVGTYEDYLKIKGQA
jgi:hypothetical protein